MPLPVVHLPAELSKRLHRGHPWVYRNRLPKGLRLPSGTWVRVRCGSFEGVGLWDARSPIGVRIFTGLRSRRDAGRDRGNEPVMVPDEPWVASRVRQAWQIREPLRAAGSGTSAYRWLYGESDGLPGVVVDLYGDYAVVETYAESLNVLLDWIVRGLDACTSLKGVLKRGGGARHGKDVRSLWGRQPSRDLIVQENGLRLYVDLLAGQKTGLYLDHRENRLYLEPWCAGKRVLNCFAYTGAFSLYALRGGAVHVTSVDSAVQAAQEAARNLRINGYDPDEHPFLVADCFDLLAEYAQQRQAYDLIILDPPSLARSKKSRHAAERAYVRLNQAALRCIPPGGLLATASCTSQVSPQAFRELLGEAAAQAGKRLLIVHEAGHAIDHPVAAHFPEGRYLKFVLGRVQEAV
jgi:23S rRNA (cytosine1962-C5)-methyltransferase